MEIMGLGIDYATGAPLFNPQDEAQFADLIHASLPGQREELGRMTRLSLKGDAVRGEVERQKIDPGDPRQAGWTYLVNAADPQLDGIMAAIRPLAEHRGMANPGAPLLFSGQSPDDWFDWLIDNYSPLTQQRVPLYILIVGGPDRVPFRFQSLLQASAVVGRIDLETLGDLEAYVARVLRLEKAAAPATRRQAVVFATDDGFGESTYFSHNYLARPLSETIDSELHLPTVTLFEDAATKARLLETLRGSRPSLVFTASHGMVAPGQPLALQQQVQGAICCQHAQGDAMADWLLSAADIPGDGPFLEGSVVFQFACFGYGTPAESDYAHWRLGQVALNVQQDFIAAIPRRLLAHPEGPVGYIGHVDASWVHGFIDPENRLIFDRWHPRIAPFVSAVRELLGTQPIGLALSEMHKRYNFTNSLLTELYDRDCRGRIQWTSQKKAELASTFITRGDAQNHMVFGDPAAHLRIPDKA